MCLIYISYISLGTLGDITLCHMRVLCTFLGKGWDFTILICVRNLNLSVCRYNCARIGLDNDTLAHEKQTYT